MNLSDVDVLRAKANAALANRCRICPKCGRVFAAFPARVPGSVSLTITDDGRVFGHEAEPGEATCGVCG